MSDIIKPRNRTFLSRSSVSMNAFPLFREDLHPHSGTTPAATEAKGDSRKATPTEADLEAAYRRGLEEGHAETERALRAERAERDQQLRAESDRAVAERCDALGSALTKELDRVERQAEEAAVRMSVAVASLIIRREVGRDREIVLAQVREAMKRLLGIEHFTLRVNPIDEPPLRDARASMIAASESVRDIVIEADGTIEPGGCILESETGSVDARLSTQLKKLESVLLGEL